MTKTITFILTQIRTNRLKPTTINVYNKELTAKKISELSQGIFRKEKTDLNIQFGERAVILVLGGKKIYRPKDKEA